MANCFSKLTVSMSSSTVRRKVISASASIAISTSAPTVLAVMRLAASAFLFSLPVMCRRSKPSSPCTLRSMPPMKAKAVVVSTVTTSSPLPPSTVSVDGLS